MDITRPVTVKILNAVLFGLVAFCLYSCMYALRKPFAVGKFEGILLGGIDYKIILIFSQVLGYAFSKFFGIKYIAELRPGQRPLLLIVCMLTALLALLGFALVPAPYNFIFLFMNGLPLGLVWGLVFSYLEGRSTTEIMASMLSISFILASGFVKSAGKWLMLDFGITEFWMPLLTGILFIIPMVICIYLLDNIPPPDESDRALRSERPPMDQADRQNAFNALAKGLIPVILLYMIVTAMRDLRDNFAVEMWESLGVINSAAIFTQSEIPVAIGILLVFALTFMIKANAQAFSLLNGMILTGLILLGCTSIFFDDYFLQRPMLWTILTGVGLYLVYFPFNSMYFDRLVGLYRQRANSGFFIYIADAFGYLGSILILVFKTVVGAQASYLSFFNSVALLVAVAGITLIILSWSFFYNRFMRQIN